MNGVVSKQDFTIIKSNPTQGVSSIVSSSDTNECCYELIALAEIEENTSDLKNDKHSVIWFFSNAYTSAEMTLQKYVNGAWTDFDTLNDDTYGNFYDLGFYTTIYEEYAIGYQIDWFNVLNVAGIGDYRVKCTATLIDSSTQYYYSFEFCLKVYQEYLAQNTTRLSWYKNGNSGSLNDDTKKNDYGTLNWFNSIRIPNSIFGRLKPTKTKNFVRYQTGEDVRIFDADEIEYILNIDQAPLWLAKFIGFDANYSNNLTITDYNSRNHEVLIDKKVTAKTNFTVEYDYDVQLHNFEFTYQPTYNNFKHNYE